MKPTLQSQFQNSQQKPFSGTDSFIFLKIFEDFKNRSFTYCDLQYVCHL